MRLMIYGLFGTNNFGDELFSKVITDRLRGKKHLQTPYVFTTNERASSRNLTEFNAIDGYPLPRSGFGRWFEALGAFRKSGGLLFGGGGLFNEVFLRAGIANYGVTLATAKAFGMPYIMHGVEIGYVGTRLGRWVTAWCLRNASRVICRNDLSVERAKDIYNVDITRGVDINHTWLQEQMAGERDEPTGAKKFVVNLQHSLYLPDPGIDNLLNKKVDEGFQVIFVTNEESEEPVIKNRFSGFPYEVLAAPTVRETIAIWKQGDEFMTERFHFTMASLHANAPTIVIISSSKVKELMGTLHGEGVDFAHLRSDGTNRDILQINASQRRAEVVDAWAEASNAQLDQVIHTISSEGAKPSILGRIGACIILPIFYGILVYQYARDRTSPLNRELDTSVT